jgi:predicted phosphodiesterase
MVNKDEKILIVSDLHLTTNFIQKKYNYLEKLFLGVDKIIINGDFWTAYYNTFEEFLETKWNGLFPILLSKKTVYIYGNHDKEIWQDDRNKQFSLLQLDKYKFETHGVKYLITHGHTYLGDSISHENFMKVWRFFKLDIVKYLIESLLLRALGRSVYKPASIMNNKVKSFSINQKKINYLVIGHTHWAEIDIKSKLINSGIIHSGVSNYILITNGIPKLIKENY